MSNPRILDQDTRYALQMLSRHQMIKKMLADIATDMTVCKLEKWDIGEFPRMLKIEIDRILSEME